jgi:O-antigen/teichoic acid export membrane protein
LSAIKQLASQTAVYGLSSILGRVLSALLVPLYTAYLYSVEDYGVVTIFFTYAALLNIFFTYGMETGFFRYVSLEKDKNSVFGTIFRALTVSSFVLALPCFLFAEQLASAIGFEGRGNLLMLLGGILFLDTLTVIPFAWLRNQNKSLSFVKIKLTNLSLNVGFNLLFIPGFVFANSKGWLSFNPEHHFVYFIFLSNVLSSFSTLLLLIPTIRKAWGPYNPNLFKAVFFYSLPLVFVGLAGIINETLDRLLIKYLLSEDIAEREAGIYSAFYKLGLIMTLFLQAFRYAAEPFFFGHSKTTVSKVLYARVMDYFVWFCGFLLLGSLLIIPWFAEIFIRNPLYFEDGRGLAMVPLILLANLCLGIYYNLSIWYKLSGKTMMGGIVSGMGALFTIFLNLWLIPIMGFTGAAITTLLVYFSMMLISFILGQKYYPVPYHFVKLTLVWLYLSIVCITVFFYGYLWLVIFPSTLLFGILFLWIEKPYKRIGKKGDG